MYMHINLFTNIVQYIHVTRRPGNMRIYWLKLTSAFAAAFASARCQVKNEHRHKPLIPSYVLDGSQRKKWAGRQAQFETVKS